MYKNKTLTPPTGYLSPAQVALKINRHVQTVYNAIKSGELRAENFCTGDRPTWWIPPDAFVSWKNLRFAKRSVRRYKYESI